MAEKKNLKFVFVHGLCGWGSYDRINRILPYWGMRSCNLMKFLRKQGFDCYAASVAKTGSAWDRSCELYAQLTGTKTDYGKVHSEKMRHERFGPDYTGRPLLKDFEHSQIVLLGHSFGGATVRLFSEILANGSEEERAGIVLYPVDQDYAQTNREDGEEFAERAGIEKQTRKNAQCLADVMDHKEQTNTQEAVKPSESDYRPYEDISPFFLGGHASPLCAIVTLSAPNSGSTAYDMGMDKNFKADEVEIPKKYLRIGNMVSKGTLPKFDQRELADYAFHDMFVDHAMDLNDWITTLPDVYYFAVPCSSSDLDENGHYYPNPKITEAMFMKHSICLSVYTGVSAKRGIVFDESWQETDGLVNTISGHAPIGEPALDLDPAHLPDEIRPGIWYNLPVHRGDHMSLQGGQKIKHEIRPFYIELLSMIQEACD